jgi:hypothetical protein
MTLREILDEARELYDRGLRRDVVSVARAGRQSCEVG